MSGLCFLSEPGRIQTCNLQSRNLVHYSVMLRVQYVLMNSLPTPVLRYFSRFRAVFESPYSSLKTRSQGLYALVDLVCPELCCLSLLSKFVVIPM
jgi:hypothetical protein